MLIISALDNLSRDQIFTFVDSLNKIQYKGKKIMVVYSCDSRTRTFLEDNGWKIYDRSLNGIQVVTKRFQDFAGILENYNDRQVLVSDCRDVYFHKTLDDLPFSNLYIGLDGSYNLEKHEWAITEFKKMYPREYTSLLKLPHLCAGVFYGTANNVAAICKDTFNYTFESKLFDRKNPGKKTVVDQLAFNIVAYYKYKYKHQKSNTVINLAMTDWDIETEYTIYHQYDRVKDFWIKLKNFKGSIL